MSKLNAKEILERANKIYRQEQRDRLGSYIRGRIESHEVLAVLEAMVEAVNEKLQEQDLVLQSLNIDSHRHDVAGFRGRRGLR